MDDFYSDNILDHYTRPHHFGELDGPDIHHEGSNPLCGDELCFDLKLDPSQQRVADVGFSGVGCAISKAAASMLTDRLVGMTLAEIRALTREDIMGELGLELGPVRMKCAMLPLQVVKAGITGRSGSVNMDREEDLDW